MEKVAFSDIPNPKTVNTLTANEKHCLLTRDNLTPAIQMQVSKKEKTFSEFFFAFSKPILNFKHFSKKYEPHSSCLCRITGSEKHE